MIALNAIKITLIAKKRKNVKKIIDKMMMGSAFWYVSG
jgi:hypothetical protein